MQAHYKKDRSVTQGGNLYCCEGHDGKRKWHKKEASRRFRRAGKAEARNG